MCDWPSQAVSSGAGAGVLQKLGRVLREKAATDLDRILNGASKTREKLGVGHAAMYHCAAQKLGSDDA